jgi:Leucine-rich repeat (LRR) protein
MELKSLRGLERFTGLKELDLYNSTISESLQMRWAAPKVERLLLADVDVESLVELEGCEQLEKLELRHCKSLKSLQGLEQLTNLKELELGTCTSLDDLQNAPVSDLRKLTLHNVAVKSLSGLDRFRCLEELTVRTCYNLETLQGVPVTLRSLCLSRYDMYPWSGEERLMSLDKVETWSGVERLVSLDRLFLYNCNNLDTLKVVPATNLTTLGLSSTTAGSFAALARFTNLKRLILSNCINLDGLQYVPVPNLTELTLINNAITSLTELGKFTNLKALMIVSNFGSLKKDDINGLRTHPSLKKIVISHREVELKTDLEALFAGSGKKICVSSEY